MGKDGEGEREKVGEEIKSEMAVTREEKRTENG